MSTYLDKSNIGTDKFELEEDFSHLTDEKDEYLPEDPKELSLSRSWENISEQHYSTKWDWNQWIARGYLTMVVGMSGIGKSNLLLRICGCYTNGWDWPDGSKYIGKKCFVLWCEGEAAQSLNLTRAKNMGLDISRILTPFSDPFIDFDMEKVQHNRALSNLAHHKEVGLIVLDSYSGIHAGDENSSDMNRNIYFLARLTRDTQKSCILSHHLRKKGQFEGNIVTLDRVRGSSAIPQTARVVIAIDQPNPKSPIKRLNVIKSNLSAFPKPIGFKINEKGVQFVSAPLEQVKKSELGHCKYFLSKLLANGPVDAEVGLKAADDEGLGKRTLDEAKKQLGIITKRIGGSDGKWQWSLPGQEDMPDLPVISGPQVPPGMPVIQGEIMVPDSFD
jgi:energy-coupling factor transporter ATP-binding protein EcfA2